MRTFGLKGISLCIVLLMVLVLLSMSGEAFSTSLPPHTHLETLPYLPEESTSAYDSVTGSSGTAAVGPFWTKSVFQSLRNESDWDIYLTQAWNENPTRITSNVANDTQPNLNRGTTRVAFVSDRNENNEIYTMNTNGSSVRRLTYTEGDEYYPVWSPDGNKIAFYANRNNSIDIYVMNADGNNQTRLTFIGLNRYPHWSPDGSQLVFAAYRNGQYGIWKMNADGSNAHQIGNSQPYAQHPLWSWDGQYILYDADSDGDGFNEICVMNADGTQQRTLVNGGTNEELWANSWMYTGYTSQFAFTRLRLIQYEGNWYWQWAHVETQPLTCGWGCYPERLTYSDLDWAISNQTSDITPPMAWFKPLPEYSRYSDVALEWEQRDDLSGSPHSQQWIQVRENGGVWTDWTRGTDLDSMPMVYSGTSGSEVAFRIRVGDPSSNWNQWTPEQHVPHTKLYAYNLSGAARDNRGLPIPHGEVIVSLPVVGPVTMGPDGRFALRLEQGGATQFSVNATGYGAPVAWQGTIAADVSKQFTLPPSDDTVQNGDFEAENFAAWTLSGDSLPVLGTDTKRSGSAIALLRVQQGLELGETVPISTGVSLGEIIDSALDASGHLHLLALNDGGLNYLAQDTPDTWGTLETVVPAHVMKAAFAVAGDGTVHVIWLTDESDELLYRERGLGGVWSESLVLTVPAFGADIAVDSLGGVHVSYIDPFGILDPPERSGAYQYRSPQGDWGGVMILPAGDNSHVLLGPGDRIFVAFTQTSENSIICSMDHPYGEFECYAASAGARHMVVDESNSVHIITEDGLYAEFDAAGMPVSGCTLPQAQNGMLAVDSTRNLYLVSAQGGYVRFRYKVPGDQWTVPVILTTQSGTGAPQIHSDAEGHLSLVFEQSPGTLVMVRNLPRRVQTSALSQVITIPEDMHKPTLSFDYTLTGALHDTDVLSATLVGEGFAFSLPVSDNTTDWQRMWADVSPWVGETVTLTLAASVEAPQSNLRVSIDDISLGSWLTPLPVAVTPAELTPDTSVIITITGSNFIEGAQVYAGNLLLDSTWISETEIAATAPATLALGEHLLRVVNPGGQTGYAPQVLFVGEAVYMPLLLKSSPWVQ